MFPKPREPIEYDRVEGIKLEQPFSCDDEGVVCY